MLSGILHPHKEVLESTESYLLPHMNKIIQLVRKLEEEAGDEYIHAFHQTELSKGEFLLTEGNVCRCVWFLSKGVARVFLRKDGNEITRYFFYPGELIDAYCSSCRQVPSEVNIQLIQDATVYSISRNRLKCLAMSFPLISEIEKLIVECHTIWLEKRVYNIQYSNATEQYLHMLQCQIPIIRDVPVTYIASYLGVSLETLSRIRRKVGMETLKRAQSKVREVIV